MPGKAEEDYNDFFLLLKRLVGDNCNGNTMKVKKVICDFEQAIHNSILESFGPDTEVYGCFFHFSQCIWRRVQSAGMVTNFMDKNSKIRRFFTLVVSMAHVPPNRLKEAYGILKEFKLDTEEENEFKQDLLRYLNQQWLNNKNMPVKRWNVWKRKKNLTNNAQESFNGRLKQKMKVHNPNPYVLLSFLKNEMFTSGNMIQDFELGEVPQRRYLKQERIDKSRKKCKSRLKNDSSYRLETYMFAMGSYTVKSDLGIISEGQRFNHIENTSHYETILPTPGPGPRLNVNKAKKRNRRQKRKSMNASYLNGTADEINTDSATSASDTSIVLPEPPTPRTKKRSKKTTKSRKQSKLVCPVDNKGFNVRSTKLVCTVCGVVYHSKCVSWIYDEENFKCQDHDAVVEFT